MLGEWHKQHGNKRCFFFLFPLLINKFDIHTPTKVFLCTLLQRTQKKSCPPFHTVRDRQTCNCAAESAVSKTPWIPFAAVKQVLGECRIGQTLTHQRELAGVCPSEEKIQHNIGDILFVFQILWKCYCKLLFKNHCIQRSQRLMKRCSTLLATREMQIKTTVGYHFILVRMAIINKSTNKCWRGCGEKGTLVHIVGGNADSCSCCGKQYGIPSKN